MARSHPTRAGGGVVGRLAPAHGNERRRDRVTASTAPRAQEPIERAIACSVHRRAHPVESVERRLREFDREPDIERVLER